MMIQVSLFLFSLATAYFVICSSDLLIFCNEIIGYYDTDGSCFKVFNCDDTYNNCAQKCKDHAATNGIRGRLGIIPGEDLVNRLKAALPSSFDISDKIFVGAKTLVPDSQNPAEWFWYEDDEVIAPVVIYSTWMKWFHHMNEDCGYLAPKQKWFGDQPCDGPPLQYMLCEFVIDKMTFTTAFYWKIMDNMKPVDGGVEYSGISYGACARKCAAVACTFFAYNPVNQACCTYFGVFSSQALVPASGWLIYGKQN